MKLFNFISIAALCIFMCSCSSNKNTPKPNKDEREISQLCHYVTDNEYFYANAFAESTDRQMAKDKAIATARAELSATLSTVVDSFSKRYRKTANGGIQPKTEDRLILTSKTTLKESIIICDRITQTKDNTFRAYVTIQLSKADVSEAIKAAILEDEESKVNFSQKEFDKSIDESLHDSK